MKLFFLFIIFFCATLSYSQSKDKSFYIEERKKNLFFSIGSEYRITPIYSPLESILLTNYVLAVDAQNSGAAINYSLDYFITKNLALGFSHSIRYDVILNDANNISSDFGAESAQRGLIFGYHFYLDYHLKAFKNSELFLRLGKSLLNRGTDFTSKSTFSVEGFGDITTFLTSDFAYEPWNFAIGYKKQRFSLIGGIYSSSNTEYFQETKSFIIPYFSLRYNLGKLWNNN